MWRRSGKELENKNNNTQATASAVSTYSYAVVFERASVKTQQLSRALAQLLQQRGIEDVKLILPARYEKIIRTCLKEKRPLFECQEYNHSSYYWMFSATGPHRVEATYMVPANSLTPVEENSESSAKSQQDNTPYSIEMWKNLPVAMCITNNDWEIEEMNPAFEKLIGSKPEVGSKIETYFTFSEDTEKVAKAIDESQGTRGLNALYVQGGGSYWQQKKRSAEIGVKRILMGTQPCLVWLIVDNSEFRQMENRYRSFKQKFNNAIQAATEGIWEWSKLVEKGDWWSDSMYSLLGLDAKTVSPSIAQLKRLLHPADKRRLEDRIGHLQPGASEFLFECRLAVKEKGFRWFRMRVVATFNNQGEIVKFVGSLVDVNNEKVSQLQLQREKDKVVSTLNSIVDAVISTNEHGVIEYMNTAACRITGLSVDQAVGKNVSTIIRLFKEHTDQPIENPVVQCLSTGEAMQNKMYADMLDLDNTRFTVQTMVTPLAHSDGKLFGAVLVINDVTNIRILSRRLKYQASHDILTKLYNRSEFERKVKLAINNAKENEVNSVVMYVDLDRFKLINDVCGHIAGDELLKQIGKLIKRSVRKSDVVARMGGDEFAVLFNECQHEYARTIADKILSGISSYRFAWEDKIFNIEASIGIAGINSDCEGLTFLLNAADSACYLAKEAGRNCIREYQEGDRNLIERKGQERWVQRFDRAIEKDLFDLHLQKIQSFSADASTLDSFEVLVRMRGEDGSLVPPNAFLPAVERYDRAYKLDCWIIDRMFRALSENQALLNKIGKCSINLSGQSVAEPGLLRFVQSKLSEYEVYPEKICFEITETAAIANLSTAIELIHELKSHGFLFALDDFGAGLSSFAYLKSLPVDFLKIDGIFVKDIHVDEVNRAMVKAITDMGKVLHKETIAEYVENEEIVQVLKEIGVDYGQGFHIGKPKPMEEYFAELQLQGSSKHKVA